MQTEESKSVQLFTPSCEPHILGDGLNLCQSTPRISAGNPSIFVIQKENATANLLYKNPARTANNTIVHLTSLVQTYKCYLIHHSRAPVTLHIRHMKRCANWPRSTGFNAGPHSKEEINFTKVTNCPTFSFCNVNAETRCIITHN